MRSKLDDTPLSRSEVSNALSDWAQLANQVSWPGGLWAKLADQSAAAVLGGHTPAWNTPDRAMALGGRWPAWVASFSHADDNGRYGVFNTETFTTMAKDLNAIVYGGVAEGPAGKEIRAQSGRAQAMWPEWERVNGEHALDRAYMLREFIVERSLFGNTSKLAAEYAGIGELVRFDMLPGRAAALGVGWGGRCGDESATGYLDAIGTSARVGAGRLGKAFMLEEEILTATNGGRVAQAVAPFVATLPFFTVTELARRSEVSYNSAAAVLAELESGKIVERSAHEREGAGGVFTSKPARELYETPMGKLPTATAAALAWTRKVARMPSLHDAVSSFGLVKQSPVATPRRGR